MPKIFISYRRDDSAFVSQQVYEKLKERFGERSVFIDVDGIPPGVDFVDRLEKEISQCDVLLAIMGDRWLDARFVEGPKKGRRRLDDPEDLVRIEIASALRLDIPVIPVLVGKISMADIAPSLPPDLEKLKTRNATLVRAGQDLPHDLQLLSRGIKEALRLPPLTALDLALPPHTVVVPKGLRSFDSTDAGFFIRLLPGPYRDDGLPESIHFWKTRIEEHDPEKGFRVGVIYGPSGCGKSSLVKAGLLPHLAGNVTPVYVEATANNTQNRLAAALRKRCPYLSSNSTLQATLHRREEIPADRKVLIVLDQFEQFLHSTPDDEQEDLVEALRECDGQKLQCILLVRDDFLTPVSRFMKRLKIPLGEERNYVLVDLFDQRHAKKVLAILGQAYGGLPKSGNLNREQDAFLNRAVSGLAERDRVICVRLALFAQMVRAKEWTPATLKAAGGAQGVGAAFLEDSFVAETAPEENRRHQAAAQIVLGALLPESGTSIRGAMRKKQELLARSGYHRRPEDFEELLSILDNHLRLVTPTNPQEFNPEEPAISNKYYQLTHDYLVPSLREWLSQKQTESWSGRAKLRLAERSASWNAKPENRHLPAWWEMLNILVLTKNQDWTTPQRKMMKRAERLHLQRGLSLTLLFLVVTVAGLMIRNQIIERANATHAAGLVQRLEDANIAQVPKVIEEMKGYRRWTTPLLKERFDQAPEQSRQKLHLSLALLPVEPDHRDYLYERLLNADPQEVPAIREALTPHKKALVGKLWNVIEQPPRGKDSQRLRAACMLAIYDPSNERWKKTTASVAEDLVKEPAIYLAIWMESLRPARKQLVMPLAAVLEDTARTKIEGQKEIEGQRGSLGRTESERCVAAGLLADYAADRADILADAVMNASDKQFSMLFPKLKAMGNEGAKRLLAELEIGQTSDDKEKSAKRRANAAVALLKMDKPEKAWDLLKYDPDPRLRSYLTDRFGLLGADIKVVVKQLEREPDPTARRALVLALREIGGQSFTEDEKDSMVKKLRSLFCDAIDPGIHAAARWMLQQWEQDAWIQQTEQQWAIAPEKRLQKLADIRLKIAKAKGHADPQWYVNGQGQTMVVIPGPVQFFMGSPPDEEDREDEKETQHSVIIDRSYAISATEVTIAQFSRFLPNRKYFSSNPATDERPVTGVTWYEAVEYCKWLSEREGLKDQCCYPSDAKAENGMKLRSDFISRIGYRLPTEAEWEYACRAGAQTARYYGESVDLLSKFAWCRQESPKMTTKPVGTLRPNDFGLFDMLGNADEWTHERYRVRLAGNAEEPQLDHPDMEPVHDADSRVLRGGSIVARKGYVRCANRFVNAPHEPRDHHGFRVARTFDAPK